MDSLLIRVLLFIVIFGGVILLVYIINRTFSDHPDMFVDIKKFRKNHPDEYE